MVVGLTLKADGSWTWWVSLIHMVDSSCWRGRLSDWQQGPTSLWGGIVPGFNWPSLSRPCIVVSKIPQIVIWEWGLYRWRWEQCWILCWRLTDRGDGVGFREGSAHPLLLSWEWQAADSHDGLRCWGWFQIARMAAEEHQLADSYRHLLAHIISHKASLCAYYCRPLSGNEPPSDPPPIKKKGGLELDGTDQFVLRNCEWVKMIFASESSTSNS